MVFNLAAFGRKIYPLTEAKGWRPATQIITNVGPIVKIWLARMFRTELQVCAKKVIFAVDTIKSLDGSFDLPKDLFPGQTLLTHELSQMN